MIGRSLSAGAIALAFLFAGCEADSAGKTSANIGKGLQALQHQQGTLNEVGATVGAMTPANVESQKPKASALIADAKGDNATAQKALGAADSSAKALEKAAAAAKDPATVSLRLWGIWFIVAGAVALAAGIFLGNATTTYDNYLRSGGAAGIAVGIMLLALARYLTVIVLGCTVAGLIGAAVWAYLHRADILPWLPLSALRRNGAGTTPSVTSDGNAQAVPAPVVLSAGQVTGPAAAVEDER